MNSLAAAYNATETEGSPLRSGKVKIKRYKTGRNKSGFLILLPVLILGVYLLFHFGKQGFALPAFLKPALSAEEMQQDTRQIILPGGRYFALQLGAFSDPQSAGALAESYRSRGAAGYIWKNDSYRVLAAAYDSRENALAVQQQLADKHGVDAYLCPLTRSQITLKLTGQKAQLNALSDAYDLCAQLTGTLSTLSQSLDSGAMEQEAVLQALSSQQETIHALNARLSALFSKEDHPAVTRLCALLADTEKNLSSARDAQNAVRLGSSIKYCHLALLKALEDYGTLFSL